MHARTLGTAAEDIRGVRGHEIRGTTTDSTVI